MKSLLSQTIYLSLACSLTTSNLSTAKEILPGDPKFVGLEKAHDGRLSIDLKILNQFQEQPKKTQDFYTLGRDALLRESPEENLAEVCDEFDIRTIGGPMLGNLTSTGVRIRVQTPKPKTITVAVTTAGKTLKFKSSAKQRISHITCSGLTPNTNYSYDILDFKNRKLGSGTFTTTPKAGSNTSYKIAVGADFHKIGLHRPELLELVQSRGNRAMMLLGDLAVDGRRTIPERNIDYLLRDVSPVWNQFAANVPSFTSWDDHDYYGNDTSGKYYRKPERKIAVDSLRANWKLMWNNPEDQVKRNGIYFQTVLGDTHIIMLDTRSCRVNEERGELNSFLGKEQMDWLKKTLKESKSPFILLSGGTMWTDFISNGKDSWGTWDKKGREEILTVLDQLENKKVLLFSGDRHGAHAFGIKRPNGKEYIEFGVGTLGGVKGGGVAEDQSTQRFAYRGERFWAFGELEFSYSEGNPKATFKLINQAGTTLETIEL